MGIENNEVTARADDRLPGLDAMRGVAAVVVLVTHLRFGPATGHLAVDFFFMLSGYVMARTYEGRLKAKTLDAASFLFGRYKRLWPTMAVGAVIGLIVAAVAGGESYALLWSLVFALLMVPGGATVPYVLNLPAWSIFYELVANAVHGFFAARRSNTVVALLVLLCAIGMIASLILVGFPRILNSTSVSMQLLVLVRVGAAYFLGVLLYRWTKDIPPIRIPWFVGLLALPVYLLVVEHYRFPGWPLPFIFILSPLMIIAGLDLSAPRRISKILGDMSFPLYAIHYPVIGLVGATGLGGPVTAIAASIAVALLLASPWRDASTARSAGMVPKAA